MRASILAILILGGIVLNIKAQFSYNEKGQAIPPASQPFGKEAFESTGHTVIRWLGNAGFLINSRGTCLMVDPMLKGFDMPLLINMPIAPKDVPHLDAVLITHCDNDHYSGSYLYGNVFCMPGISFYILHGFFDGNTGFELFRTSYRGDF